VTARRQSLSSETLLGGCTFTRVNRGTGYGDLANAGRRNVNRRFVVKTEPGCVL